MSKTNFNDFRFRGFKISDKSNKYYKVDKRINDAEDKIIVRWSPNQVFETAYGWGLRLDHDKGVWLKPWQVSKVWDSRIGFVYEIVFDKNYTKIATFEERDNIAPDINYTDENIWNSLKADAKEQAETTVLWSKRD